METLELARQALLVLAPFVAQGALAKIGENATDQVTRLATRAWGLLQSGIQGNARAENTLEIYQDEPDDERNIERLAKHLAAYLQQHHQVVDELQTIVAQLQQQSQQPGIQVTITNSGTNEGQQVGVNYGTMTQNRQDIHNNAPNQGAQGTFQEPVHFTQGSVDMPKANFSQARGVNISGVTINRHQQDDLVDSDPDT